MGVKIATIGVILYILVAVGVSFCLWDWLSRGEPSVSSTIRNLFLSWGAPLATGLAVWRSIVAQKQVEAAQKTATAHLGANQATGRGQQQERMKNAIEHLGNASDSVRLGGAYELFHLAEDTEDRGQRQTVLDILCAHIRWTTLERQYRGNSGGDGYIEYRDKYPSNPSEEIQSLLTLLFVQKYKVFTGLDIKLQGSCLNGSNLIQARLEKAHLEEAQLQEARLEGARLQGADLIRAQLQGASLEEAQLHGAYLIDAQLRGADLRKAQLHGAYLRGACLQRAHLERARLHGADLAGARLHGARLREAQLHGADLGGARLQGARLGEACLQGAYSTGHLRSFKEPFEASINKRIDKKSELSVVIFGGGLTQEDVDSMCNGLSDGAANALRKRLKAHIGKPESYGLPENSGASIGAYTKEEADQWIAEYKTALSAVSGGG